MKKRVFLIHGWEGTADGGWRLWLKNELETRGYEVTVPQMPDKDNPTYEAWVSYLKEIVGRPDENTFFVCHSLGCITLLRYLEILPSDQKIGGAVLVAGFGHDLSYEGYAGELQSFFATLINWEKIKSHARQFIAIQSTNDQWVPLEHNQLFVKKLAAGSIIVEGMKHFGDTDGFLEVPIIIESLLKISA